MKVVVTGGSGFIGSHIVERLVGRGDEVQVLDLWASKEIRQLMRDGGVRFYRGDVRDVRKLESVFDGAGLVIHLGSILGTSESIDLYDPVEVAETNVVGTCQVLAVAKEMGVKRVVYPSTPDVPWLNPYKITKNAAEKFCKMYWEEFGLETVVLRLTNVYGPRERWLDADAGAPFNYQKVVPTFIMRALDGKSLPVFGDGKQSSEYVHVDDVARAFLLAGTAAQAKGEVIPIGTGEPISVNELAKRVIAATASRSKVERIAMRRGETPIHIKVETSVAKNVLGFQARFGLSEGLEKTIPYYEQALREKE